MRTSINQGRIQSLAVMIVVLINNDQTPYLTYYRILGLTVHATSTHWFQLPSPRSPENLSVMKSSRYPVLPESFWQSHLGFHASALPGISAPLLSPKNVADKFYHIFIVIERFAAAHQYDVGHLALLFGAAVHGVHF